MNSQNETRDGECLTEDLISGYLEGSLTPIVKAACELHLIGCDQCRESLATLMRLLRSDIDPEEGAELQLAITQWDRGNLTPIRPVRSTGFWKRVSYIAGIAAVLVLALMFGLPSWQSTAEDLVQDLLQKTRPFDAQLSRQPYLARSATRSGENTGSSERLAEEMRSRAADSYQLGRFYLLREDYETAVQFLEKAAAEPNTSSEVHNDLGVGYLQRNQEGDLERARREFENAIAEDNMFRPAVFNLSLLYELNGMTAESEGLWKRYLELDPNSGWSQEVRRKLSRKDFGK